MAWGVGCCQHIWSEINYHRQSVGTYSQGISAMFACDFVAQPIAQFCSQDADGGSCADIVPLMAVARDAVDAHSRGHTIARHRYPRRQSTILLMQNVSTGKSYRSVSRGKGAIVSAVRTSLAYGVFETPCRASRQCITGCCVHHQPFPRRRPLHTTCFQRKHRCDGHKAQHVVGPVAVVGFVRLLRCSQKGKQHKSDED